MLHAAAMFAGLFIVTLLWMQPAQTPHIGVAAAIAFVCVLLAMRLGGVDRGAFARAPGLALLGLSRLPDDIAGALRTIRNALAADVSLRPALVRVKTRLRTQEARAALAHMLSSAPGAAVVESDDEGLLLHVNEEERVDAAALGGMEARIVGVFGDRA